MPAKSRGTPSERGREGGRSSFLCPTEVAHKAFGSSTDLAHETQFNGEAAKRSGRNALDQLVSGVLGVYITTLQLWIRRREIPFLRVGHSVRFDPVQLGLWLGKRQIGA